MMGVPIETEPTFSHGTPELLFNGNFDLGLGRSYDVSPDGHRFLMVIDSVAADGIGGPAAQIIVVQNWFTELERLVPTP